MQALKSNTLLMHLITRIITGEINVEVSVRKDRDFPIVILKAIAEDDSEYRIVLPIDKNKIIYLD